MKGTPADETQTVVIVDRLLIAEQQCCIKRVLAGSTRTTMRNKLITRQSRATHG